MRKSAIEQIRLEARAQGMAEMADALRFASKTGAHTTGDVLDHADLCARIAKQTVAEHIAEHGEYVGGWS